MQILRMNDLSPAEVPAEFRAQTYFDFEANPFWHQKLLRDPALPHLPAVILGIHAYTVRWLEENLPRIEHTQPVSVLTDPEVLGFPCFGRIRVVLENGARFIPSAVFGTLPNRDTHTIHVAAGACVAGDVYLDGGNLYVGAGTRVDRGASIQGPTILGRDNEIRPGAYVRSDVITGHHVCLRGEIKNAVMMDHAVFPHLCYVGDSLCGFRSHFGNQATTANFGLFDGARRPEDVRAIRVPLRGAVYDLGTPKFGAVIGDYCQVGCSAVTDPGVFLAPYTMVYPLTRVNRGFYGPNVVLKNKPMERQVIETTPLQFLG